MYGARDGALHIELSESLDLDLSVPALVSSVFHAPEWMAELGRVGRRQSSEAKAAAARKSGGKVPAPDRTAGDVGARLTPPLP